MRMILATLGIALAGCTPQLANEIGQGVAAGMRDRAAIEQQKSQIPYQPYQPIKPYSYLVGERSDGVNRHCIYNRAGVQALYSVSAALPCPASAPY